MERRQTARLMLSAITLSLLAACGGGASGTAPTAAVTPAAPTSTATPVATTPVATTTTTTVITPSAISTPSASQSNSESLQYSARVFSEDLAPVVQQSIPTASNIPQGLSSVLDVSYQGAFRVVAQGESMSDFAVGTLAYNPDNHSVFMAGHPYQNAVAEFAVPSLNPAIDTVAELPMATVLQPYVTILDKKTRGNDTNLITGMLYHQGCLIVNSEIWYDGSGANMDNTQVFMDANDLANSDYKGLFQIQEGAKAAGYMSQIPESAQTILGGEYLVGWASNNSIVSRYSLGPSLHTFAPSDIVNAEASVDVSIPVNTQMMFSLSEQMVANSNGYTLDVSPIWGILAKANYGFVIPDTPYFLVVGSHGGIHSGVGYKITQDDGRLCGGGCTYEAADNYNYFWLFDINDFASASAVHDIVPVSYGKWSHPFDKLGKYEVLGATFDHDNEMLYISLGGAGQVGEYDVVPLVVAYHISSKD
jgi:hypothetical protein